MDRTAPLPARRWQRLFAAVAALGLVVPTPGWHYSSLAAEQTEAELAPTCAAIYSALSADAADKNMLAMVHNYYIYSDLSPARAPQAEVAAAPPPPAPAGVDRCQVLEAKATDLMETWKFRIGEIANDPYEDKMRRLRDGYDSFRSRLEWIRDDAENDGCSKLTSEITDAFTVWVRP